jgi:hypothetical protein
VIYASNIGIDGTEIKPDRTEYSKTYNHLTHIWKDVLDKAIEIEVGKFAMGAPYRSAIHKEERESTGTKVSLRYRSLFIKGFKGLLVE